mmetsp:Transcript_34897/g.52700  ORF Transcript_34897/g.52700 Transcript_34897/m.52700 type:complete len:102 (-) Transcript_34897:420-725(-)
MIFSSSTDMFFLMTNRSVTKPPATPKMPKLCVFVFHRSAVVVKTCFDSLECAKKKDSRDKQSFKRKWNTKLTSGSMPGLHYPQDLLYQMPRLEWVFPSKQQ